MAKKEEILELLNAYKSEVDNFNDAIFTDKFEALAQDIVKLFAIPVVVKSLPSEKKMDLGEWMKYEGIKEDGFGGLDWKGTQHTAYEIEKRHKEYLK